MKSLEIVLQGLEFLHTDDIDDACIISQLEGAEGPIQGCKTTIQSLSTLLPDPKTPSSHTTGSKKRRLLSALDSLAWPLKAERVKSFLDDLMRFKSTISMGIEGTLQCLPEGLDESYERIFSLIEFEDRDMVRNILHWLCFHTFLWGGDFKGSLTVSFLIDAYYLSTRQSKSVMDENHHFMDAEILIETCGCLLSYNEDDSGEPLCSKVTLAHYTVREFLELDRSEGPSAMPFKIGFQHTYTDLYNIIICHAICLGDAFTLARTRHGSIVIKDDLFCM